MAFTTRDKLALIYTAAGSMRRLASFVGVTHQRVSRVLHGQMGKAGLASIAPFVDAVFSIYVSVAEQQAKVDGLPFDPKQPVFYRRLIRDDGVPGDRVGAEHTHWLSDKQRDDWVLAIKRTGRFYALSVESIVNLVAYFKGGEVFYRGRRDETRIRNKLSVLRKMMKQTPEGSALYERAIKEIQRGADRGAVFDWLNRQYEALYKKMSGAQIVVNGPVYTPYTPVYQSARDDLVLGDIQRKLEDKHEPHTGEPGTVLASTVLLQVDTRYDKDAIFREKHPYSKRKRRTKGKR